MRYSENVKYTKEYELANEDSDIKNKRFNVEFSTIKKLGNTAIKYSKLTNNQFTDTKWFEKITGQSHAEFSNKAQELSHWLQNKTQAIPYGNMHHQNEGRVIYHTDRKWAEQKLHKLAALVKSVNATVENNLSKQSEMEKS